MSFSRGIHDRELREFERLGSILQSSLDEIDTLRGIKTSDSITNKDFMQCIDFVVGLMRIANKNGLPFFECLTARIKNISKEPYQK